MKTTKVHFTDPHIELAHGAGGKASRRLIEGLLVPYLMKDTLTELNDAAYVDADGRRLAFTVDSYVVKPLVFPGGSIGEIAINGTVNDLAMGGAKPLAMVTTLILEAGLAASELEREVVAMAKAAQRAGVPVVGGDTKVVEHGKADGLYITTAGIGLSDPRVHLSAQNVRPGDQVILSGPIGDHGITVLLARGELDLEADLTSDTRPLWPFVAALIEVAAPGLRWMRDPTRGGLATALNELARDARVAVVLDEEAIQVRPAVRGACEILGLDPLHIANEGQFVAIVSPEYAEIAIDALKRVPGGEEARRIGEIQKEPNRVVLARSRYGGTRVIDMLVGDPLPRIC
ncbi:hydrogenase expression/formation protein HypE [Effusibacillus lacus]|uniref:Hydrogenase expression/formation protein HypE n=1 Tax=Effusibacillus lacus TaxID=1348429 RepID=A0A292YFX5_9BACL|nr:hydrogenase expression/formation protein HypE [Effusibacillus lacus]TCS69389.1 hydrogenase maturation carbamoyl dehydratase HypE [Effusibacillus lacus]GAX89157.1 hydrogenase expression/formation protein HypE [Effusibacillus lacus]